MQYDVYGLGNALVDMEFRIDDGFLRRHGIDKGHMTLVAEERLLQLTAALHEYEPERMSGGSAANTIIAVQGFGGRTFYSCRLADDPTGRHFLADLGAAGVATNRNALAESAAGQSGRCLVLVTPDAERSMNTFLGISTALDTDDIDEAALAGSKYFYAEGYLSSSDSSLAAAVAARQLAESTGVKTAISLSDPSMVTYFRDNLTRILGNGVDYLFCNEEEALNWAGTDRIDLAVRELRDIGRTVCITLGKRAGFHRAGRRYQRGRRHLRRRMPVWLVQRHGQCRSRSLRQLRGRAADPDLRRAIPPTHGISAGARPLPGRRTGNCPARLIEVGSIRQPQARTSTPSATAARTASP